MIREFLQREVPNLKLFSDRPYREITTLGVGSTLPLLAEPDSAAQLAELFAVLRSRRIPWFLLGAGSNIVGMDDPYPGVAIRLNGGEFSDLHVDGELLVCGAGVRLPQMVPRAAALGMGGIAPLAGIPGSVGGALRMNAGCCGIELSRFLVRVHGVRADGSAWHAEAGDLVWEYRAGGLPSDVAVTRAEFRLERVEPEAETEKIQQALAERRLREPAGRSAGCAFRNVSDLEPAGRLIDECGLRGLRVGDIAVSEKHANYIMNLGTGSEADFITVSRLVRRAVAEKFGFYLRLEARTIRPESASAIENDPRPPMVNVLYGGDSSEREVSIRSGEAVAKALTNAGFRVVGTDIRQCEILPSMRECDLVYPVLHGGFGEGGDLQELMEKARIKFVGSGSAASRLVMDKIATKRLLDKLNIPTARWREVTAADLDKPPEGMNFPLILKAPCEGSTVGIVRVKTPEEWRAALEAELKFAPTLLVEEFIEGVELTVPILSGATAEAIEIRAPGGFYDYDAKYLYRNGHTEYFCPPVTPSPGEIAEAKRLALYFYRAAGCLDVLRVDFIIGRDGVPYVLEGNSIPGCTATSLVPKAARQAGISFEMMASRQLYAALKRSAIPVGNTESRSAATEAEVSPALLKTARTLYAIVLGLAALSLLLSALKLASGGWSAWPLLVAALLLVLPIRRWLDRWEK